jgi:putative ABC transport system permease protein
VARLARAAADDRRSHRRALIVRQIIRITAVNLRSIVNRPGQSLAACVGVASAVAVLVSVLAMATGIAATLERAAREDRAIVLREGATNEGLSSLPREAEVTIASAPGIARLPDGKPAISFEAVLAARLPVRDSDRVVNVTMRGWNQAGFELNPQLRLIRGRPFRRGVYELVVGRLASREFANLDLGGEISIYGATWKVVGVFSSNGDIHESEIIADAPTLMSASNRTLYNAATVAMQSPESCPALQAALKADPRALVDVRRQQDYYEAQSQDASRLFYVIAYVVGSIMAAGALVGALNTMYNSVAARTVEIATLRALGFGSLPVFVSVVAEAVVLAAIGALLGAGAAWLLLNGVAVSTNGAVLEMHFGWRLFATGMLWALVVGLAGGIVPAWRAVRLPVTDGLRVVV